ncbi:MAG: hypothetical protein ABJE47_17935 [bacterium]
MPQPAVAALEGAAAAASALPLELRDGAGSAVPHAWVQVSEWNLFSALPDPDARRDAEAAAAREGFPTRGYVLVVTGIAPKVHGAAEEPPD